MQHDLMSPTNAEGERFTVVAARGGDDIWIEIRRHRYVAPEIEPTAEPEVEPVIEYAAEPVIEHPAEPVIEHPVAPLIEPELPPVAAPVMQAIDPVVQPQNGSEPIEDEPVVHLGQQHGGWPPAIAPRLRNS